MTSKMYCMSPAKCLACSFSPCLHRQLDDNPPRIIDGKAFFFSYDAITTLDPNNGPIPQCFKVIGSQMSG